MLSSRFPRFRTHFMAASMFLGIGLIGYATLKAGLTAKKWLLAPPRLLHQEMEDFLMMKDREARLKALEEQ